MPKTSPKWYSSYKKADPPHPCSHGVPGKAQILNPVFDSAEVEDVVVGVQEVAVEATVFTLRV
eukprot:gene28141-11731_t